MSSYPLSFPLGSDNPMATLHHPNNSTLWEFEMHNGKDNRLTATFLITCLAKALDVVEKDWRAAHGDANGGPGALIISGKQSQEKFFSNGLDFAKIAADTAFFPTVFNPTLARLLTFPIPTIAAINGHAFAAGFLMSLACDYRIMQRSRGWCCMNEVLFGAPMPFSFSAVLNYKLSSPRLIREVCLEGRKFTGTELHDVGVVDILAEDGAGVLKSARDLAAQRAELAKSGVWGLIKKDIMRRPLEIINADYRQVFPAQEADLAKLRL